MALSIKTEEADRLARELARRTGRSMTEAVTIALRERLKVVVGEQEPDTPVRRAARLDEFLQTIKGRFGAEPVTKEEWDEACGDVD